MNFRFYSNMLSQASKNVAAGFFIIGLLLVGFGFMIYILKELFAALAAIVFFVAGIGCGVTAVKILLAQRKLDKFTSNENPEYRKNVQIHIEEHFDD